MQIVLWLKTEGEKRTSGNVDKAEVQLLYSRLITDFFDMQADVRYDPEPHPRRGLGVGVNDIELGLRLRYEIRRVFAPYIGVNWERKLSQTADIARSGGEDASIPSLVAGIRFWF